MYLYLEARETGRRIFILSVCGPGGCIFILRAGGTGGIICILRAGGIDIYNLSQVQVELEELFVF